MKAQRRALDALTEWRRCIVQEHEHQLQTEVLVYDLHRARAGFDEDQNFVSRDRSMHDELAAFDLGVAVIRETERPLVRELAARARNTMVQRATPWLDPKPLVQAVGGGTETVERTRVSL